MPLELRETPRLAVLIDAENIAARRVDPLFKEIAKLGRATTKRIYGDWTRPDMGQWRDVLHERALVPIQQFRLSKGRNCVDCALIVDAMDLLYTGRFDGFCLVSSDGDFTRLASRLRESGPLVYGFGEKTAPAGFRASCDRFFVLEPFPMPAKAPATPPPPSTNGVAPAPLLEFGEAQRDLVKTAYFAAAKEDEWLNLCSFVAHVRRLSPAFDPRAFGFAKLSVLIESIGLFEVKKTVDEKNPPASICFVKWTGNIQEP